MIGNHTRKDEALDRLTSGIAQLTSSDRWTAWLRVQARFHSYSFNNTILILVQRPTASRVGGFHTRRRLGRFVRGGEQASGFWLRSRAVQRTKTPRSRRTQWSDSGPSRCSPRTKLRAMRYQRSALAYTVMTRRAHMLAWSRSRARSVSPLRITRSMTGRTASARTRSNAESKGPTLAASGISPSRASAVKRRARCCHACCHRRREAGSTTRMQRAQAPRGMPHGENSSRQQP